jgi:N-acetylmuramoyl-L-alanine amidase
MRSCGNAIAAVLAVALLAPAAAAQSSSQARSLFEEAVGREGALRKEMDAHRTGASTTPSLLRRIRVLVTSFEDFSRLFPGSGYEDRALLQGGALAGAAFWQFGEGQDRTRALDLFGQLLTRFPQSALAKQAEEQRKRLLEAGSTPPEVEPAPSSAAPPGAGPDPAAPAPPPEPAAPPPASTGTAPTAGISPPAAESRARSTALRPATLRAVRRDLLPEAIRITLELDREVPFRDERLDRPERVFVDLHNTLPARGLDDATIPVQTGVVRQVRVGRPLDTRTRVVMDLSAVGRYSVYALYNPFRIVIDFERPSAARGAPAVAASSTAPPSAAANAGVIEPSPAAAASGTATGSPPAPAAANGAGGFSLSRQLGLGIARIVIDPGHGGQDPGAKARGLTEAAIVLDIALRLEKLLLKRADVEVVLTRRTNSYVTLEERTALANRAEADLFLSIHANASSNASARGIESYFLNFAPDKAAEAIAARENAGSTQTMRALSDIVRAIALNNKLDESRDFAATMQSALYGRLRKVNRNLRNLGVKQAPFMVLIGATMPSTLVEISFLSNKQEADLLKTDKYRHQIAEALLEGVLQYQRSLKKAAAVASR